MTWLNKLKPREGSDLSLLVVSGTGSTSYTTAFTLNHAYAFRSGSAPYFTVGVGVMKTGQTGSTGVGGSLIGAGVGERHRLAHGHGAIRVEARIDRIRSDELLERSLTDIGLHFGLDLDLDWLGGAPANRARNSRRPARRRKIGRRSKPHPRLHPVPPRMLWFTHPGTRAGRVRVPPLVPGGLMFRKIALDRKSTRLNSSHERLSRMPSSA